MVVRCRMQAGAVGRTAGSKADTVELLEAGQVTRFNPKHDYPQGCTNYDRWRVARVLLPTRRGTAFRLPQQLPHSGVLCPDTALLGFVGLRACTHVYCRTCVCGGGWEGGGGGGGGADTFTYSVHRRLWVSPPYAP